MRRFPLLETAPNAGGATVTSGAPFTPDRGTGAGSARTLAAYALGLSLLTLAAFEPVRHNGFVFYDDEDYITRNTVVKRGITPAGIVLAFTKSYAANWHPLTWISHMLDVELFGLDPRGHHLTSLAIHLTTALLILLTLRAMTGRAGPAFLVAALFAVHPLHVESVAWAAERKDVLAALFWVLTTALYLRYARRPSPARYLPVLLCFALGLMAKQMLVTLPLVLLLLDWWPLGRLRPGAAASPASHPSLFATAGEKIPLLALAVLAGLIALKAQTTSGAVTSLVTYPLAARTTNALLSCVRYLGKAVWPSDLAVFYPFTSHPPGDPRVVAAAAFLVVISTVVLLQRRRHPWLCTGWFWYLITLLPVIGLIQVGDQAMADRYTYLPLLGVFVACSWSLSGRTSAGTRARAALAVGVAVALLLLVGLTRRQAAFWHDDEALFSHALRVTRDNWKAHHSLGMAREAGGDRDGALQHYREAIRIKPGVPRIHYNYALALEAVGRTSEALEELRRAVRARPADPVIRTTLALLLSREGLDDEAIANLRTLVELRPDVAESYNNLAALLAQRGQVDEAAALLRRALEIDPAYADALQNLEALTGERRERPGAPDSAGVPSTHRGLFGDPPH